MYNETMKFTANVNAGYDLYHDNKSVTSSYAGAAGVSFATNGIDNGSFIYDAGVGAILSKVVVGEVDLSYDYQAQGSSFTNHQFAAKYTYKF